LLPQFAALEVDFEHAEANTTVRRGGLGHRAQRQRARVYHAARPRQGQRRTACKCLHPRNFAGEVGSSRRGGSNHCRPGPASATVVRMDGDFTEVVLPHLDAAYRLARWLMRNPADAENVVQEATLRALRHYDSFRGGDTRAWLLTIVRNTCY